MTHPSGPPSKPLWRGLLALVATQAMVAAVLCTRTLPEIDESLRAKTVAAVSGITLTAASLGWLLTCSVSRQAASRPALAVAGGLAASLLRLAVPLAALGWLQLEGGGGHPEQPLRNFIAETIVASYLSLLLVDILLHTSSRSHRPVSESAGVPVDATPRL